MSENLVAPIRSSPSIEEAPTQEKQNQGSTPPLQPHPKERAYLPDRTSLPLVVIAVACIIGCITTVYFANGRIVAEWVSNRRPAVQPTVLLALFAATFGLCVKFVFASGVAIVWWRTFESNNPSLADLHYIYKRGLGEGFGDAWKALSSVEAKLVLAVFILTTVVDLSDGPLLQRAIRTELSNHTTQFNAEWSLVENIEDGWVGAIDNTSPANLLGGGVLDTTLQDWYLKRTVPAYDCGGTCEGLIETAGIDVTCSSSERTLNLTSPNNVNATLFSLSFNRTQDSNGIPMLEMTHLFMNEVDDDCVGTIGIETCSIRTAKVAYNIHQDLNQLRLNHEHGFPRSLASRPSSGDLPGPDGGLAGPLAALEYFGHYYLQSNGTLMGFDEGLTILEPSGALVQQYLIFNASIDAVDQSCSYRWENATDDVLWNLHDVMFRLAWRSSKGNETTQSATWTRTVEALTYHAEYVSLWVAAGLMLVSITATMSLFWGYWQLGRKVSLSPLETGRALASVIMAEPTGERGMDVEQLLKIMGDKKRD